MTYLFSLLFFSICFAADDFDFVTEDDIRHIEGIVIKKAELSKEKFKSQEITPKNANNDIKVDRVYKKINKTTSYHDEITDNQRSDFNLNTVEINDLAQTTYPEGNEIYDLVIPGSNIQTYLKNDLVSLSHRSMPVTVEIREGGALLHGSYLIGESILDTISRSPVIMFNKISLSNGQVYNIKASGQFSDINKKCEYSTNKGKIFGLNLLAAATSGWLNSKIPTDRGILGSLNVQRDNDFKTQTIQGVSHATSTMSDELVNEFKQSGAFSFCKGKRYLDVSVLESPNI